MNDLSRLQKILNTAINSRTINFRQNSKNGMDTSLEWKIVIGQRRFISGHHMVGGQQSWKNQVTDFMRSRNLEEDMA